MQEIAVKTYSDFISSTNHIKDCYTAHFKTYLEFREKSSLPETTAVYEYFKELNNSGYKAGTIRMKRAAVKNRIRMAIDMMPPEQVRYMELMLGRLDRNPETKAPKLNNSGIPSNKIITTAEYDIILNKVRSKRQEMFIRFLYATGCRVAETAGIKLDDCAPEGNTVYITVMGKGKKERIIRIEASLYLEIKETFQGLTYLFETSGRKRYSPNYISDQIAKITLYAIGRKLSAHKLRHTFVTRKIAQWGKWSAVSEYVGHASPSITLAMYNHEQLTDAELFN